MAELRQQRIIDVIQAHRSIRTYRKERITENLRQQLLNAMKDLTPGPFGHIARFRLLDRKDFTNRRKVFGTYGACEDYGYLLEKLILTVQQLDLGSCWLGGTIFR